MWQSTLFSDLERRLKCHFNRTECMIIPYIPYGERIFPGKGEKHNPESNTTAPHQKKERKKGCRLWICKPSFKTQKETAKKIQNDRGIGWMMCKLVNIFAWAEIFAFTQIHESTEQGCKKDYKYIGLKRGCERTVDLMCWDTLI